MDTTDNNLTLWAINYSENFHSIFNGESDKNEDVPIPSSIALAGIIVGIALIVTGVFGNAFVILSVMFNKHLCKASNAFIISLAVCDIFQNIAVKTFYVHTYVTGRWVFNRNTCIYVLFASNLAILESILHVTSLAFFRYLVIVHPRIGQKIASWKAVSIILPFLYLIPIGLTIGPALPKARHGNIQFNKRIMFCSFVQHTNFKLGGVLKKVVFLLCSALVILYSYVRIYCKSKNTFKSANSVNDQHNSSHAQYYGRVKNDLALLRTVKIIFIAFVISYLPLSILYAVDTARNFPYWIYFIGVMLLWSSSSINWIIYFCVNRRFRRAYKNIFCGRNRPNEN